MNYIKQAKVLWYAEKIRDLEGEANMNKLLKDFDNSCKCMMRANYTSQEVIHINPDKAEENAIIILLTKDNEHLICYENKDDVFSKFAPKILAMKKSILNKVDKSVVYFNIERGDYYGTYVVSDFISNDEEIASIYDFFEQL